MRITKLKSAMALVISAVAMFVAATSSTMCVCGHFEDVKMPKSLFKVD